MHWFDRAPSDFAHIEKLASAHLPLIGNVEAELRRKDDSGAGCGCAYPDDVAQDTVDYSNAIFAQMHSMLKKYPEYVRSLKQRPGNAVVQVGEQLVAISHGDEQLLGGWSCSRQALTSIRRQTELAKWMREKKLSVLATSHTCAAAAWAWTDAWKDRAAGAIINGAVINNGAAGMPNFAAIPGGLISRVGLFPSDEALYSAKVGRLWVEALPLLYDSQQFISWFDKQWPAGSPAALSYRKRIIGDCSDGIGRAIIAGFNIQSPR